MSYIRDEWRVGWPLKRLEVSELMLQRSGLRPDELMRDPAISAMSWGFLLEAAGVYKTGRVVGARYEFDRLVITLLIVSPEWEPVHEGEIPPVLPEIQAERWEQAVQTVRQQIANAQANEEAPCPSK